MKSYVSFASFLTNKYNNLINQTINIEDIQKSKIIENEKTMEFLISFIINKLFKKTQTVFFLTKETIREVTFFIPLLNELINLLIIKKPAFLFKLFWETVESDEYLKVKKLNSSIHNVYFNDRDYIGNED